MSGTSTSQRNSHHAPANTHKHTLFLGTIISFLSVGMDRNPHTDSYPLTSLKAQVVMDAYSECLLKMLADFEPSTENPWKNLQKIAGFRPSRYKKHIKTHWTWLSSARPGHLPSFLAWLWSSRPSLSRPPGPWKPGEELEPIQGYDGDRSRIRGYDGGYLLTSFSRILRYHPLMAKLCYMVPLKKLGEWPCWSMSL